MKYQAAKVRRATKKIEAELTPERRQHLAQKGQALYYRFCGLNGEGICAESFAEYHLLREEIIVVQDLLVFLQGQRDSLMAKPDPDSQARLALTQKLLGRVQSLLGEGAICTGAAPKLSDAGDREPH